MKAEPTTAVDMSEEAVAERIATVGQLYRVCMSLAGARPIDPAVKVEKSGEEPERTAAELPLAGG